MNDFLKMWNEKWNRIVVFPGVFDPVHRGHVSAAKTALSLGRKVLLIPERVPHHKHGATEYKHRLEMLKITVADEKNLEVLDYTEDQFYVKPFFSWLRDLYPDSGFVWLAGSDVVEHMSSWEDIEALSQLNVKSIFYLDRAGSELNGKTVQISSEITAQAIRRRRWRNTRATHPNMSSTAIRENLPNYASQLPDGVYDYIRQHKLYQ